MFASIAPSKAPLKSETLSAPMRHHSAAVRREDFRLEPKLPRPSCERPVNSEGAVEERPCQKAFKRQVTVCLWCMWLARPASLTHCRRHPANQQRMHSYAKLPIHFTLSPIRLFPAARMPRARFVRASNSVCDAAIWPLAVQRSPLL